MAKFLNECMDSADWMEEVGFARPCDDVVTLDYLDNKREKEGYHYGDDRDSCNYWDYPLSETDMLATDEDRTGDLVLVRFANSYGGYEYRWCEI